MNERDRAMDAYKMAELKAGIGAVPENYEIGNAGLFIKERPTTPEYAAANEAIGKELKELERQQAELSQRIKQRKESLRAIEAIPVLFDANSFQTIENSLSDLEGAGISTIDVGGSPYSIDQIRTICTQAEEQARSMHGESGGLKKLDPKELNDYAGSIGATRKKISEHSASGFRDAIVRCMESVEPPQYKQ